MLLRKLGSVVWQNLLVHGIRHLSVVDDSIMSTLPGAYMQ